MHKHTHTIYILRPKHKQQEIECTNERQAIDMAEAFTHGNEPEGTLVYVYEGRATHLKPMLASWVMGRTGWTHGFANPTHRGDRYPHRRDIRKTGLETRGAPRQYEITLDPFDIDGRSFLIEGRVVWQAVGYDPESGDPTDQDEWTAIDAVREISARGTLIDLTEKALNDLLRRHGKRISDEILDQAQAEYEAAAEARYDR